MKGQGEGLVQFNIEKHLEPIVGGDFFLIPSFGTIITAVDLLKINFKITLQRYKKISNVKPILTFRAKKWLRRKSTLGTQKKGSQRVLNNS